MVELYISFIFGLLGSWHCLGMCGPIVMAYTMPVVAKNRHKFDSNRMLFLHLLYNLGRITTYSFLGFLAGSFGKTIFSVSSWIGIERVVSIFFGIALLILGLMLVQVIPTPSFFSLKILSESRLYKRVASTFISSPSLVSKFSLGLVLGFLPCHLIYAMLLQAAATGSARQGALLMASFGCGMMPMLIGAGLFSHLFTAKLKRWGDKLITSGVMILAVMLIVRGAGYDILSFGHAHPVNHKKQSLELQTEIPIRDFSFIDVNGKFHDITAYRGKTVVFIAVGTTCPCVDAYHERINSLVNQYSSRGVIFFGFNSNADESLEDINTEQIKAPLNLTLVKDADQRIADLLGAVCMTEVFVIDGHGILRYHGRIDDNTYAPEKVAHQDLKIALDSVIVGKELDEKGKPAIGCTIVRSSQDKMQ